MRNPQPSIIQSNRNDEHHDEHIFVQSVLKLEPADIHFSRDPTINDIVIYVIIVSSPPPPRNWKDGDLRLPALPVPLI